MKPVTTAGGQTRPKAPATASDCCGSTAVHPVSCGRRPQWVVRGHSSSLSEVALESHNPCAASVRGAGDETPEPHDGSRRRRGVSALGRRAAEGHAGDWLPRQHLARAACAFCGRVPPGSERNRLCRGSKCSARIPLGEDHYDRLPELAAELVGLKVDVI